MIEKENALSFSEGLGTVAYIFGGIILFFAAIFIFIEMWITVAVILIIALALIDYRRKRIVDTLKMEVIYKCGFFIAFIYGKTISIIEAKSVVVSRHNSKMRPNGRSAPNDYHIEKEFPDRKVSLWETYKHETGLSMAKELADLLKVNYDQCSEINY